MYKLFSFLETKGQFFMAEGSPAFGLIFLLSFDYAQGDNKKDFAAIRFINIVCAPCKPKK